MSRGKSVLASIVLAFVIALVGAGYDAAADSIFKRHAESPRALPTATTMTLDLKKAIRFAKYFRHRKHTK
jgi:hypothetical protein